MNIFSLKLKKKEELLHDVLSLQFEKPEGFSFSAGQFVQFHIPNKAKRLLRSYSIVSAPKDPSLDFLIKLFPSGTGSEYFRDMRVGELVDAQGPSGRFLVEQTATAHFFIATGVGIAPIMGMLRDEIENKKTAKEMRLLFGVRSEDDLFWTNLLESLRQQSEFFQYQITLSQPKPDGGWGGLRGRVTEHLLHHLVKHHYYLCGNAAMVRDVRNMLIKNGIPGERILFEIF